MQCHASPIYTLARNPSFFKNFITVGDWNARIWSEDCKESSIIWTKYCSVELTDGCWSPTKCSLFYLSRTDGNLEAWDLLQQQSEPILTVKVCHCPRFSWLIRIARKVQFAVCLNYTSATEQGMRESCRVADSFSYLDSLPVLMHTMRKKNVSFLLTSLRRFRIIPLNVWSPTSRAEW